ncbi:MAG: uroporphyrinogen-III C-methyltransferase [Rhodanobacteraceae bacterium]
MSEASGGPDTESAVAEAQTGRVADASDSPARTTPAPRRGGFLALIIALIALVVAGYALWRDIRFTRSGSSAAAAVATTLGDRLDQIAANQARIKRDIATQRARIGDADSVNNSMREELLSLTERSRHLEDAVGNLAEQRLSGRDAMALNEAEFLLQLGAERLALFDDANATLAAYRLADSALAAAEDPVFASVRQTIDAEMQALMQAKPLETQTTLDTLERVRGKIDTLPARPRVPAAPAAKNESRFMQLLHEFVRVDTADQPPAADHRSIELARDIATIDLRAAEAALLARDAKSYKGALDRVGETLRTDFDPDSVKRAGVLAQIDRLADRPLSPPLPELGSALKELRNLRATRALSRSKVTPKVEPDAGPSSKPPTPANQAAASDGHGSRP